MAAQVLAFQPRTLRQDGWANSELAEFYRLQDLLHRVGLPVASDVGETDEGDPWLVFFRTDTGDVLVHFAREGSRFIAVSALNEKILTGRNLREIVDQIMRGQPLVLPAGVSANGTTLRMHPVTVLLGFIAAALYHSQAHAATKDAEPIRPEPKGAWTISLPPSGTAKIALSLPLPIDGSFSAPGATVSTIVALLTIPADGLSEFHWQAAGLLTPPAIKVPASPMPWESKDSWRSVDLFNTTEAHWGDSVGSSRLGLPLPSQGSEVSSPVPGYQTLVTPTQYQTLVETTKPGMAILELSAAPPPSVPGQGLLNTSASIPHVDPSFQPSPPLEQISVHMGDLSGEARLLLSLMPNSGMAVYVPVTLAIADLTPDALQLFSADVSASSGKITASTLSLSLAGLQEAHGMEGGQTGIEASSLIGTSAIENLVAYANDPSHQLTPAQVSSSVLEAAAKAAGVSLSGVEWVVLYTGGALSEQAIALGSHGILLNESLLPPSAAGGLIHEPSGQALTTVGGTIDLIGVANLQQPTAAGVPASGGLDQLLAYVNNPLHALSWSEVPPGALVAAADAAGLGLNNVKEVLFFNSKTFPLHSLQLGDGVALLDEGLLPLNVVSKLGGLSAGQPIETSAGAINLVGMVDVSTIPTSGGASGGLDTIIAFANDAGHLLSATSLPEAILDSAAAAAGLPLAGIDRVVIYHSSDLPLHALELGTTVAMLDEAVLPASAFAALGALGGGEHLQVSAGELTLVGVVDLHHGG